VKRPEAQDVPIACTLEPDAVPARVDEWHALFAHTERRIPLAGSGTRIELDDEVALEDVVHLVEAERRCCSFLSFAVTVDGRGRALEVSGPGADVFSAMLSPRPS
jgi:hypothetical protein